MRCRGWAVPRERNRKKLAGEPFISFTWEDVNPKPVFTKTGTSGRLNNQRTQTSLDGRVVMPEGVTLGRLTDLLFESPKTSVANLYSALARGLPAATPAEQLATVEAVIFGMEAMARRLLSFLAD